jgi:hypothetical protein
VGLKNGAVDPEHKAGMGRSSHSRTKGKHPQDRGLFLIIIKAPRVL